MGEPAVRGLTEKQAAFVKLAADGVPITVAATKAGYTGPGDQAYRVAALPHIQMAITSRVGHKLRTEGAPVALSLLLDVLRDEDAPLKVRVDAAKTVLDRAGHIAPKAAEPDKQGDKPISEMSAEELRAFVDRAQGELANRARPVIDMEPNEPPGAQQPMQIIDLL